MSHECGHSYKNKSKYTKSIKLTQKFQQYFNEKYSKDSTENAFNHETTITLWTSYLGPVVVPVWESPVQDNVFLQSVNSDGILVKVLELRDVLSIFGTAGLPDISFLRKINPASVNVKDNEETYNKIQKYLKYKEDPLFKNDVDLINMVNNELAELYIKNICVDIYFNSLMYLKFLKEKFGRSNINSNKELISIYNIPDLDNAFFTGEYMVYGNGSELFYPLGSPDVTSHELTHGLTETLCALEYLGESGALNESFSDIFGTSFEFWLHETFKELHGSQKWTIGSLIGHNVAYLRNMENPEEAHQPSEYKGRYWADTTDVSRDCGGVHTNSGPCNRSFFLISKEIGINEAIKIYYKCLGNLENNSQYSDFARILIEQCPKEHKSAVLKSLLIIKIPIII